MARKAAEDSIAGKVEAERSKGATYDTPEGLPRLTGVELKRWHSYTKAKRSWKSVDLVELYDLIKMKTRLAALRKEAAKAGLYCTNGNGAKAEHPIHRMVREEQKLVQAQLRVLGLNSPHNIAEKNAGEGEKEKPKRPGTGRGRGSGNLSLIA